MNILGYSDPFTTRPGETVQFMVSSESDGYEAEIVRLIHGDLDERGPGLKYDVCDVELSGGSTYKGRVQRLRPGSYIQVDDAHRICELDSFTMLLWLCPTTPGRGLQGILTCWSPERGSGFALFLGESGALELWIGNGEGSTARVSTERPLEQGVWYFAACTFDARSGQVGIHQLPLRRWPHDDSAFVAHKTATVRPSSAGEARFLMGAVTAPVDGSAECFFNGKLENPMVFDVALDDDRIKELSEIKLSFDRIACAPTNVVAAWDFSLGQDQVIVHDGGPNGFDGRAVNAPTRAVTSSQWKGREPNFRHCPEEYAAIHFHDDDLEDAGWEADFSLRVSDDLRSGYYAAHLTTADGEDWIPFIVAPAQNQPTARIAVLAPTLSYLAYANEHMIESGDRSFLAHATEHMTEDIERQVDPKETGYEEYLDSATKYERGIFEYIVQHRLHSLYDPHSDGSGVCYSSRLRPLLNMRPTYNKPSQHFQIPHQLNADLYIIDWLESKRFQYDVITDDLLDVEGEELLKGYDVVLTGTHPEYVTNRMLDALESYLTAGGRVMYLGGNGFYWVTSIDPGRPHLIEVRRGESGTRSWSAFPGENYHSTTGELGGIWRSRGRPPQRLVGVGFTAQGADNGTGYARQPGSLDPRASFIFEGVGDDEVIGDFGIYLESAGGWELDRHDEHLGSPPHCLVLATTTGHSDSYQHVVEEVWMMNAEEGGTHNALVHADLVYFEYSNGGAVFSTGAITWSGSLSYNSYENNVSAITENVLRAFASDGIGNREAVGPAQREGRK